MSKIVTQDKLNELTGMSIDLGRGGTARLIRRNFYIISSAII